MAVNNEEFSGSDSDDGFDEDMEALRRACLLTGTSPNDLQPSSAATAPLNPDIPLTYDSEDDDVELVRSIQRRFSISTEDEQPLNLKPLCSIPPPLSDGDCEDDFETLRAIQRRFADYSDSVKNSADDYLHKPEQVGATNIASEKESSNNLFVDRTNIEEGFPDCVDASIATHVSESIIDNGPETQASGLIEWHESGTENAAISPIKDSGFPKSAQAFVDAIKKNRSCQKFLRSKLMQIESRIEENRKLRERVKILKDFQVTCRKRTGRALSQKRDARVQLISTLKPRANAKVNEKKVHAMCYGPAENSHVAIYKMVLTKFPLSLSREKWSKEEKENLAKGIKQQFQENLLKESVKRFGGAEGYAGDSNDIDSIIESIRDLEITPEKIRLFLPQVNWEQLASMYVTGRSGAECEARWLNCEDPLINRNPWTTMEDKNLLHIVQQRGIGNWIDIAVSLGTNRTPFQCLARYQRSLNASIMKREWTEDDDDKLRSAVEAVGESNWQLVASKLEGRTGTQCSNRWKKTLHPTRQRVGTWTSDEDKRLKVAVMLFGAKNWKKIAEYVPGRTQVQCRERWVNCLDPSLNMGEWTEDEDSRLKAAIAEHGYCWSKVAACVLPRTDSQCRRRWKVLLPHEVPLLQAARKVQKAALISNFVDRESERPALGPKDFVTLPMLDSVPESEIVNCCEKGKRKRKSRRVAEHDESDTSPGCIPQTRSKRLRKEAHNCSEAVLRLTDGNEVDNFGGDIDKSRKKRVKKPTFKNTEPAASTKDLLSSPDAMLLSVTSGKEVGAFAGDNVSKKKRGPRRGKRKSGGRTESKQIATASAKSKKNRVRKKTCSNGNEGSDRTNSEVEGFRGDDITQNTKASKSRPRKNRCTLPLVNVQVNASFDEAEVFSGNDASDLPKKRKIKGRSKKYRDSGLTLNDEEIEAFDVNDAANKKQALNPCSPDLSPVSHSPPSVDASMEPRTASDDGVEALGGGNNTEERPIRCSTPDILDSLNPRALIVSRQNRNKRPRKMEMNCSNQISEKEGGGDITLASFLQQSKKYHKSALCSEKIPKPKRSGAGYKTSISGQMIGEGEGEGEGEDGDGMTLAMFCSKLKKRKRNLAKNGE